MPQADAGDTRSRARHRQAARRVVRLESSYRGPVYNTQVAAKISALPKDYRGSYVLTFAGDNAGRGRVEQWIAQHGDPRDPNVARHYPLCVILLLSRVVISSLQLNEV